ncbi:related to glutaminyl cyclase [Ramularia collo-cygni]|uniref:Peptide hydrolase n=1 Tax=Ramularia collo-cygni TaxID=112498 RepID=A0A2D3USP4_9PEZI|nr:related to glutaminyl cyclase [Ramularia collo-cygni]CZT20382.1 related to glutaminyl cyclase [Ramularia collo-cygni]
MKIPTTILLLPTLLRECVAYTALSDSTLQKLPSPGSDFDIHTGSLLSPILRTRVPGTPGNTAVLQHFVDFFTQNLPSWTLSFQNSTSTTPTSPNTPVPFTNLIATRDPPWTKGDGDVGRLALVAHYDSKLEPKGFIGATDSAAPCAMLLHTARSIDAALTKKWAEMSLQGKRDELDMEGNKGVQILLLDGEEAFQTWTDTDSLYGARSLAEEWEGTAYGAWNTYHSPLASIDLFVLLDLLGSKDPKVPSYFKMTHWAYQLMATAEKRLREIGRFKSSPNHASKPARKDGKKRKEPMFLYQGDKGETEGSWNGGFVEDDHVPFMARGVDILHVITTPFPRVWHTMDDDGEHLHGDTVEDWAVLTTAFAAEWLDLEGFMDGGEGENKREEEIRKGKDELNLDEE